MRLGGDDNDDIQKINNGNNIEEESYAIKEVQVKKKRIRAKKKVPKEKVV